MNDLTEGYYAPRSDEVLPCELIWMIGMSARIKPLVSKVNRKEEIVEAATNIISLRGYYGFSVQDVATCCGLTVAGVLHYFGTKENLLIEVLLERDRRDIEFAFGSADWKSEEFTKSVTLDGLVKYMREIVVRNSQQPNIVRLYSILRGESLFDGHPAREYFEERDILHENMVLVLRGKVDNPMSVAHHLFAVLSGLEILWLRFPDRINLVEEWDRAIATVLKASVLR